MTAPGMPTREIPTGITAEQAAILAAQQAYAAQQEALRQQLAAAVIALWAGTVGPTTSFSPSEAGKWVERILPISLGAQRAMTAVTVAALNQMHRPPTPITIAPTLTTGEATRGRPPTEVYERPFNEIRWQLSRGKTVEQAIDAGRRRALSIATTDLQLAHTKTAKHYIDQSRRQRPGPNGRIVGYRRRLSNNPNHCALCVLASTVRYTRNDLMAIHPGCGCTVETIHGDFDPGTTLDDETVTRLHEIIRRDLGEKYVSDDARSGRALYRDIVITHEHGELGPVLGVRGQHFERDPGRPGRLGHVRVNPIQPDDVIDLDEL